MAAEVGQLAPDFTARAHNRSDVTLSEYQGSKNVLLSFHIFSFTGGWTDQVSSFRANNHKFEGANTQILGVSADSQPVQRAYSASLGVIPYPILSDFHPHGKVSQAYGVYNDAIGASRRAVVLIDKEGVVRHKKEYASAGDIDIPDLLDRASRL